MYFFTSDTHFGSDPVLKRELRPFSTHQEYKDYQLKVWNSQAGVNDTIFHLGDFINYNSDEKAGWEAVLEIPKEVIAPIVLIIGNNEERVIQERFGGDFSSFKSFCLERGFKDVRCDIYLTFRGEKFFLNHFPSRHRDDAINLFGHVHRVTGLCKPFGYNISADINHFFLLSEDNIFRLMWERKEYWDNDVDVQSV